MARLADHPYYPDFAESLSRWEGCRLHFYADSVGLITLGIGHLFDQRGVHPGMPLNYGLAFAQQASIRYPFTPSSSAVAVYEDWRRVKNRALSHHPHYRNHNGASYASAAHLRISRNALEAARSASPASPERAEAAQTAYDHFRRLYDDRKQAHGTEKRYFRRHHQRVVRLREGLETTFGVTVVRAPIDENWFYDRPGDNID